LEIRVEPAMAPIPEGWFSMGCQSGRDDEKPLHRVWVDSFELGVCQVTNGEYSRFLEGTGHAKPVEWGASGFSDPKLPVVGASWHDAVAYCDWLNIVCRNDRASGKGYRLPTEAGWERAARGGVEDELYPWGDMPPEQVPDYVSRWKNGPEQVALYPPNAYGLFNLGDNVHEWCSDWYDAAYYARSPERNPTGPEKGSRKASRGGSWRHHIKVTRTAARSSIPPEFKYADYGFRVARSAI
jgi:sulfatase modifying factor 1